RLELEPADVHPEPRAVHRLAEPRQERHEEQRDRAEPEEVLVVLEQAVVAAQTEQHEREDDDTDDDPRSLLQRIVRAEAVDLDQPDRGQQRRDREQIRIRVGNGEPRNEVRREIEREEVRRVRERRARHVGLQRDVDRRESGRGDEADDDEIEELAVAARERQRRSPQTSRTAAIASKSSIISTRRTRAAGLIGSRRATATASGEPGSTNTCSTSSGGTTIVSTAGRRTFSIVSSASSTAGMRSVASASDASEIANATTVMLSSPPPRFAADTSDFVARSRSSWKRSRTSRMSASRTMSVSPSEQMRKTSPSSASIVNESTSTSGSVPTARVITDRCGCVSASSGESFPLFSSSFTSEWSSVICSIVPLR